MDAFLQHWGEAAYTTLGFFWMALWAFALGYLISSGIQVLVTSARMQRTMGKAGAKSVGLATFFGFISSSCSFAALATTRSLFKKGAGLVPALAFLLASTNLVIELGIVIAVFLSWQFIVGEYLGGILLILFVWLFVKLTRPKEMVRQVREELEENDGEEGEATDWKKRIRSKEGWIRIGQQYIAEWKMVWKDVTVGFTLAGIISAFVPSEFFQWLFVGTGGEDLSFLQVLEHSIVGPVAAFFTFIGSMGNIPLAALLFDNGVSTAGVLAFIFSDLIVFPVLRINAGYYGWKMALYIALALFTALVGTSLLLHYGFEFTGLAPDSGGSGGGRGSREFFGIDYSFVLNLLFIVGSGLLVWLGTKKLEGDSHGGHDMADKGVVDTILYWLALVAGVWLIGGMLIRLIIQ